MLKNHDHVLKNADEKGNRYEAIAQFINASDFRFIVESETGYKNGLK